MSTKRPLSAASSSVVDTDDGSSVASTHDVMDEPLFHVLGQFLVSGNKSIADILADLVTEVAQLREAVNDAVRASSKSS